LGLMSSGMLLATSFSITKDSGVHALKILTSVGYVVPFSG